MSDHTTPAGPLQIRDLDRPVVSLGVALLATAVVLSTFYSRLRPELDWSNYAVGLLATAGLLGIAVATTLRTRTRGSLDASTDLVTWPGAFGAVGVGLMIGVGLDDSSGTPYIAGLAVLLLSLAGLALTGRGPFAITAVGGLFVVCAQLFEDVVEPGGDDGRLWPVALGLLAFAVLVAAAGWRLPTRAVTAVTAGAIAVAGFASLTGVLAISAQFQAAFMVASDESGFTDLQDDGSGAHLTSDTWITLVLALLLIVAWTGCAALTGHLGFRILVVAIAVSVTPLATIALQVAHPTWWGVVLAALGGAALVATLLRTLRGPAPVDPA